MDENEDVIPLRIAAQQAIEADNMLCEQLRSMINTAFGDKVVTSIRAKPTGIGINFELTGHWDLPKDLWPKFIPQSN